MNPLWILLIGMLVVVGGVLVLRLHAFLALIAGAIVVALLTPTPSTYRFALRGGSIAIASIDAGDAVVHLKADKAKLPEKSPPGTPLLVLRPEGDGYRQIGTLHVLAEQPTEGQVTARLAAKEAGAMVEKTDVVISPAAESAARSTANRALGERIAEGFAETAKGIAILIAMASIVGETLLVSGAAERIVFSSRRALGDNRAGLAFLVSGYVLGIPVFFDTVFYLLIPLGKVMRLRTGRDYTLYVLCIVAGATMTHSLVPPTPGPLFVAEAMKVELWRMILGGLAVSAFTAIAGYAYAVWANKRWPIPLRADAGVSDEPATKAKSEVTAQDASSGASPPQAAIEYPGDLPPLDVPPPPDLPPLWLALLPIVLPVLLIAAAALVDPKPAPGSVMAAASPVVLAIGEKNVALTIAAVIGLLMVVSRKRNEGGRSIGKAVGEALGSAGVIILITSAGGAFGYVLRQTDIAETIKDMFPAGRLALIPLAFGVATLVRTAQGSATVAMITAAGIVSPIAAAGGLGFHPLYLALAIGCGSKPIMWMNDSGFWIIGKMSGMTEGETLRTATVMMALMGVAGLAVTMLGAWLLPMAQ